MLLACDRRDRPLQLMDDLSWPSGCYRAVEIRYTEATGGAFIKYSSCAACGESGGGLDLKPAEPCIAFKLWLSPTVAAAVTHTGRHSSETFVLTADTNLSLLPPEPYFLPPPSLPSQPTVRLFHVADGYRSSLSGYHLPHANSAEKGRQHTYTTLL